MKNELKRLFPGTLVICLLLCFGTEPLSVLYAASLHGDSQPPATEGAAVVTDESSPIVQQGLTIHELDKELLRLKDQETAVTEQIAIQQEAVELQKKMLDKRTEAAGKILRAYYMGQRDRLWMLLFQMNSLSEAIIVMDYLQAIISNDFRTLEVYRLAYQEQQTLLADLEEQQQRLRYVIAEHERQRERLIIAQGELDRQLAALTEAERQAELEQLTALTTVWEEKGVPLLEQVMEALSVAMVDLPELLSDPSLTKVNGMNLEIQITDDHFNGFLRERNPLFHQFDFIFSPDGMSVTGMIDGESASFSGVYIVQNEPENALHFQIEQITFRGYELPDTTRLALQNQYDFTFEPGKIVNGLIVSDLVNEDGRLTVQLGLSFAAR